MHIYTTIAQYKEESTSRMSRNQADCEKFTAKLDNLTQFSCNRITDVNANEDVNVFLLFSVGCSRSMDGQSKDFEASNRVVTVFLDRTKDPDLIFQRFLVVSQTGNLRLDKVMNYELCLYPCLCLKQRTSCASLISHNWQQQLKTMQHPIQKMLVTQTVPVTDHNVLDGESFFHRLKQTTGCTYNSFVEEYASFTILNYANATVVFDRYEVGPSKTDCTHQRQS